MTDDILGLGDVAKANTVHTYTVVHPDTKLPLAIGEGSYVELDYVGFESDAAKAANHENRQINYKRATEGLEYSAEVEDAAFYRLLAYCSTGWRGIPKAWLHGPKSEGASDPLPFTRETALKLYARLPWFRIQANEAMRKVQGFTKASSEG